MKSEPIISVTQVTDDETGMYHIGELDYSIRVGPVMDFFRKTWI